MSESHQSRRVRRHGFFSFSLVWKSFGLVPEHWSQLLAAVATSPDKLPSASGTDPAWGLAAFAFQVSAVRLDPRLPPAPDLPMQLEYAS